MIYRTIISAPELSNLIGQKNLRLVDCRFDNSDTNFGRKAYAESHIPAAVYAHLDDDLSGEIIPGQTGRHPLPDPMFFANQLSEWGIDKNTQVVVYDNKNGALAARLWWMLRWLGHESVAVLDGGWQGWVSLGVGATNNIPIIEKTSFRPVMQEGWVCNVEEVIEMKHDASKTLIDSRAAERYRGEIEPLDPIAGHIPGAINMPFPENWNTEGRLRSKEELQKRFAELPKESVFYCGSGVTACHNILAYAHAGLGDARLYPGSWSEWIVDKGREIA